jgi:hypothetical protein
MKQIGLITLIFTGLTFGCQPTKNQETVETTDSLSNDGVDTLDIINEPKQTDNGGKSKEFTAFEMTFDYKDKEQNFRQRLGVTWLTSDSIEFRLLSEDELCDTDYWGNAKNKYADMDPESDEDETGESYLSSEYVTENESYRLKIRISVGQRQSKNNFC